MENSIIDKLNNFLIAHNPITEECHVVYLLIEIRKLMDQACNDGDKFKILRFYCDWIAHIEKSQRLNVITPIIKVIENDILKGVRLPEGQFLLPKKSHASFVSKNALQISMRDFFSEYKLPMDIFYAENWQKFVILLIQVLIDQPIKYPTVSNGNKIASLCFKPEGTRKGAHLEITLENNEQYNFLIIF